MSKYLIREPNKLYEIYSYKDVVCYYPYDFLYKFTSVEVDIFYDILNTLPNKDITTIYQYLMKQWRIMSIHINDYDCSDDKKAQRNKKTMLKRKIEPVHHILTQGEFNDRMNKFIKKNKIISLMVMNILNRYLYP